MNTTYPLGNLLVACTLLLPLSACSRHIAPNQQDMVQAYAEQGITLDTLSIHHCTRYNYLAGSGDEDEDDPHFDYYRCDLELGWTDSQGIHHRQQEQHQFNFGADHWHLTD